MQCAYSKAPGFFFFLLIFFFKQPFKNPNKIKEVAKDLTSLALCKYPSSVGIESLP